MAKPLRRRLDFLADEIAGWASGVQNAADALLCASAGRLIETAPYCGDALLLRGARFETKLYLARQGERVVFFFLRKDAPVRVVLDTRVTMRVAPTLAETPSSSDPEDVDYRIVVPPFVVARPTPDQFRALAPRRSTRENCILLRVGEAAGGWLAVQEPDRGSDGGRIRYTRRGQSVDVRPVGGRWPLGPFLALIEAVRSWVARDFELGEELPLSAPEANDSSAPRYILHQIVRAYCQAVRGIKARRRQLSPVLETLRTEYGVHNYLAQVVLRLIPGGKLASDDEEDPFQLLMRVRLLSEDGGTRARVAIGPPDFLISGSLHRAFLSALAVEGALAEVAGKLGVTEEAVRGFLRADGPSGSIFRVKRTAETDTNVFVIPGTLAGERRLVILRAQFRVNTRSDVPVKLVEGTMRSLYAGAPEPDAPALDQRVVDYSLRLIAAIKNWIDVLR